MVKRIKSIITLALFAISMLLPQTASAQGVSIKELGGWFESGYITWAAVEGATSYNVYVKESSASSWTKLDSELVRKYPDYYRADAIGIKAGTYKFKVVPADANGEMTANATESESFTAAPHDRSGFAHVGMPNGIGAYKNDGTLKDNAKVIYVWADNAKTVSTDVITSSKGGKTTGVGLQDIIYLYQKGYDTTPLDIRIIGTIKAADMDRFDSSEEGLQVKGRNNYSDMPITIEGVGNDATIHGFGILVRGCHGTELRNFAIMLCMDDCISLDTGNSNVWVHNMDLFYGNAGGDADQAKGDGTIDIKGQSMNVTVSYNHFFDSGKCSLGGMKDESTDCWMTYHHNWFDHSDSRHPRIRTAFYHVYNNYYDGNAKYGIGVTSGGSAFVENNFFRNCKYPMLISKQGTDAEGDGTFSGEAGGVIKAFNNDITGARKVQYYDGSQTNGKWDAVRVDSRDEAINAVAFSGGTPYNSAADLAARTTYIENKIEEPATVPATVQGTLGAGRINHGDFHWTFDNAVEDANYAVIKPLKDALIAYKSTLIGFAGGSTIGGGNTDNPGEGGGNTEIGGETGEGEDNPDQPIIATEEVVCNFLEKKPSSTMVTVSGNYSNSKGETSYNGTSYGMCVKMESATTITIKPAFDCTVTLVFDAASKKIKIDGNTLTTDANSHYTFEGKANTTYTLTKGDTMNLFLVIFTPKETTAIHAVPAASTLAPTYNLSGVRVHPNTKGFIINNGVKKFNK